MVSVKATCKSCGTSRTYASKKAVMEAHRKHAKANNCDMKPDLETIGKGVTSTRTKRKVKKRMVEQAHSARFCPQCGMNLALLEAAMRAAERIGNG